MMTSHMARVARGTGGGNDSSGEFLGNAGIVTTEMLLKSL